MIIAENLRAAGRLHALDADVVFDGDRNSRQRPALPLFSISVGALQRPLAIDLEKRIERFVELLGCGD